VVFRNRAERDLADELDAYVAASAAEKIGDGVEPGVARRLALLELGGLEQTKERVRSARHGASLDEIGRDVAYAGRVIARQPGFAAIVVVTLALGVGANTAIFSLIDALMLRWLPVSEPRELVQIGFGSQAEAEYSLSYAMVQALAEEREIFRGVAGFSGNTFKVGPAGAVTRVRGALVTGGYYETLGVRPAIGRLLTDADDRPGAPLVAVIGHEFWTREYGRRPAAVGQTLLMNGMPVTIVGVSARGFGGANVGAVADITMPVASLAWIEPDAAPLLGPGNFWLRALARPARGMPAAQMESRLAAVWPGVAERVVAPHWPPSRQRDVITSRPVVIAGGTGWTYLREIYTRPLFILMGLVGLVLLTACANVASLMLARVFARHREIAVRLALGAGRRRVVRQLAIESAVLALGGAGLGLLLAWYTGAWLVDLMATGPGPLVFDLRPNARVLGFTFAVAIGTVLVFGMLPALHGTAAGAFPLLKEGARATSSRSRLLSSLVVIQVALSLVLLAGALLFGRTLENLHRLDPGFEAAGVLFAEFESRGHHVPPALIDELRHIPQVRAASVATHTPLSGSWWSEPAVPAGQPIPERDTALFVGAGPDYFTVMGIGLTAGRGFDEREDDRGRTVAVVNEMYARRHFESRNPIGQRLAAIVSGQRRDLEIVGVARDVSSVELRAAPPATVYVPYAQLTGNFPSIVLVRAVGSPGPAGAAIRQALQRARPHDVIDVRRLDAQVASTLMRERLLATLAGGFGALATFLAAVGVYGLVGYGVTQRTQEIGIRMAVGAGRSQVVALVLRGAAALLLGGVVIGLPATWAASRWVESMLFGLSPGDPESVGGAVALLTAVALAAAALPAWRAARVDPLTALRRE
jgi:predicted permease